MRIAFALPLLLLAACRADVNQGNDSVTLQYDENLAENTAETVVNETEQIAGQIANDVEETADTIGNRVDVDVDTDGNEAAANAN
jgi:hypothetical protein